MDNKMKLLLEVAEQFGEKPVDFYDHLKTVYEMKGVTPMEEQASKGVILYKKDKDQFVNARDYFEKCLLRSNQDYLIILELNRDDILGGKKDVFIEIKEGTKNFFSKEIALSRNKKLRKCAYAKLEFFENFIERNSACQVDNLKVFLDKSKIFFRRALEAGVLINEQDSIKAFFSANHREIVTMKREGNARITCICLSLELWAELEKFKSFLSKDLSSEDVARGLFFFTFEILANKSNEI
ncbi:hypothetical protein ACTML9_04025 [Porphyromonas levii]|uniref:hypothetical protein n=1 Tax=Porphyromonas levii TaxID=28114 RepID=UPI0010715AAA|nr:hypothetical protein [Porphyromonas levii]TFH95187.1 hypothetical protein E4P48_08600 [Porphyromonas levii]